MSEQIVYVVTDGDYSDYYICGVFSTEKKAQVFIDKHNVATYHSARIEEKTLDVEIASESYFWFHIIVGSGEITSEGVSNFYDTQKQETVVNEFPNYLGYKGFHIEVLVPIRDGMTKDRAQKIAIEKRQAILQREAMK